MDEWDEPLEAQREAFTALVGYINSHLTARSPGLPFQPTEERQKYICLAMLCFGQHPDMSQGMLERYWKDLIPVDESLPDEPMPDLLSESLLSRLPPPAPQPAGVAILNQNGTVSVDVEKPKEWGFQILAGYGGVEEWEWIAMTMCFRYTDFSLTDPPEEGPPIFPSEKWRYRIRLALPPESHETCRIRPFGLWSDPIGVSAPG